MKAWEEVTERERGWIEGILTSGRHQGKRGTFHKGALRITLGREKDIPIKLCELLGGIVKEGLKKHAFTQVVQEGRMAGKVYTADAEYLFTWIAGGDNFIPALARLAELNLPCNLRSIVDAFQVELRAYSH